MKIFLRVKWKYRTNKITLWSYKASCLSLRSYFQISKGKIFEFSKWPISEKKYWGGKAPPCPPGCYGTDNDNDNDDSSTGYGLPQTVHVVSEDIGMEFGIEKCSMLVLKLAKLTNSDGITLCDEIGIETMSEDDD